MEAGSVEDGFPCTPHQQGFVALMATQPSGLTTRYPSSLRTGVDVDQFKTALETVVSTRSILRTRVVDLAGNGLVQVVTSSPMELTKGGNLRDYVAADKVKPMDLGTPLSRYALVDDRRPCRHIFVWTIHRALYDAWSLPLLLGRLEDAYEGMAPRPSPPFQGFAKHIVWTDMGLVKSAWQKHLNGLEASPFPALPSPDYEPRSDSSLTHSVRGLQWPEVDITATAVVRTAFSILLARYTNAAEVVFGRMLNGRQAAVQGVEMMTGPTTATVPVRVRLDQTKNIRDFLLQVQ